MWSSWDAYRYEIVDEVAGLHLPFYVDFSMLLLVRACEAGLSQHVTNKYAVYSLLETLSLFYFHLYFSIILKEIIQAEMYLWVSGFFRLGVVGFGFHVLTTIKF